MTDLLWLPGVLRASGVAVVEEPGWRTRRNTDGGYAPRGLMWHHDASAVGPSPNAVGVIKFGRAGLRGALAQVWVDYFGAWHLCAAGRAWHAGIGSGWGVIPRNDGNTYSIGIETDLTTGEPCPPRLYESLVRGSAAICRHTGWNPANALCGHKEFAPGRKPDPASIDMHRARAAVARMIANPSKPTGDDEMSAKEVAEIQASISNLFYAAINGTRPDKKTPNGLGTRQLAAQNTQLAAQIAALQSAVGALVNNDPAVPFDAEAFQKRIEDAAAEAARSALADLTVTLSNANADDPQPATTGGT